ncbi:MAG: DNA-3-methyladenine glycosylase [Candidatus Saccharimonadales bacterium]
MTYPILSPKLAASAAKHLASNDPALAPVIAEFGLCNIQPHQNYYQELVDSIVSQQLSIKAAASIMQRFIDLFNGSFPSPEAILQKSAEDFRGAGLSYAKANYIRDLAERILDGRLKFDHLDQLNNDEIVKELTAVKGVGEWTADMFMMFCMGRPDVLATGDLGIKNGIRSLYKLKDVPTPEQITKIASKNSWHPYETVACWYIWRSLRNKD